MQKTVTVNSNNKDDAYVATVLLFNNIQIMCNAMLDGWTLKETYTDTSRGEYITAYTNGKMFIRAISVGSHHTYTFGPEESCKQQ